MHYRWHRSVFAQLRQPSEVCIYFILRAPKSFVCRQMFHNRSVKGSMWDGKDHWADLSMIERGWRLIWGVGEETHACYPRSPAIGQVWT